MAWPERNSCPYCGAGCLSFCKDRTIYACGMIEEVEKQDRSPDCYRKQEENEYKAALAATKPNQEK